LTLTFDRAIRHIVLHQSSTSTYIPNFIQIEETFCGRTDVRTDISPLYIIRSTLGSRPKYNIIILTNRSDVSVSVLSVTCTGAKLPRTNNWMNGWTNRWSLNNELTVQATTTNWLIDWLKAWMTITSTNSWVSLKADVSKPRFLPGEMERMKPKSMWITWPSASSKMFPLCLESQQTTFNKYINKNENLHVQKCFCKHQT